MIPLTLYLSINIVGGLYLYRASVRAMVLNGYGVVVVVIVEFIAYSINAYHTKGFEFESPSGDMYSIQHYVIKFVSDLQQVGGFLRVLWFRTSIKLIATI
jgi:hypothetical protein